MAHWSQNIALHPVSKFSEFMNTSAVVVMDVMSPDLKKKSMLI